MHALVSLIIESSGSVGRVGLARGELVACERALSPQRRHAADLAPALAEVLTATGVKPSQVDVVMVSLGPGSYTGLRVGIMTAKAWAHCRGCKLIGVPTLHVIAARLPASDSPLEVIEDAQQQRIYRQSFTHAQETGWAPAGQLRLSPIDEWLFELPANALVSGPGLRHQSHRAELTDRMVAEALWDPAIDVLLQLGLREHHAGRFLDPIKAGPIYLRGSSAEEKWDQREAGKDRSKPAS